jgi:hypothetical protein
VECLKAGFRKTNVWRPVERKQKNAFDADSNQSSSVSSGKHNHTRRLRNHFVPSPGRAVSSAVTVIFTHTPIALQAALKAAPLHTATRSLPSYKRPWRLFRRHISQPRLLLPANANCCRRTRPRSRNQRSTIPPALPSPTIRPTPSPPSCPFVTPLRTSPPPPRPTNCPLPLRL